MLATIGALGCLSPPLSAKCDFPRDCPKFIVRQGHASYLKLWEVELLRARHDACIRYEATPGVNETGS